MARGNIDYDQIQDAVRQGNGAKFQMFGGGSVVTGAPLLYDADGNAISGAVDQLVPTLPADATKYLDGTGAFSVPAGSGGGIGAKLFDSTLGSAARSIDTGASGIAGGYDLLLIWILCRINEAVTASNLNVTFNNDTGSNYDREFIRGNNTTASASNGTAQTALLFTAPGTSIGAGVAGVIRMSIPGYAQTTFNKAGEMTAGWTDTNPSFSRAETQSFQWRNTAAITRMAITPATGSINLLAGSRLLIYGF